jgi:hypothetical protein
MAARAVPVLLLFTAACGDNLLPAPDVGGQPDPGPTEYQPGRVGAVRLLAGADGRVEAELYDRPEPLAPEIKAREGACVLYSRPAEGTCTPACSGEICTSQNECTAPPRRVNAGAITVTGLRAGLVFRSGASGYQPESQPAQELFDNGARIRVSAPGGEVAGFSAELVGVPRLEVDFERLSLRRAKDTRLTWTAAGVGRIAVAVTVGRPDAPYSSLLLCEDDDNGAMTVPGMLVARLPEPRAGEVQAATVTRLQRVIWAAAAGPIELVAGSQVAVGFERR